jgi:prevent-host-death family protein
MGALKTIAAAEANRQFSAVLRQVAEGTRVLITSRGLPVATIEPVRPRSGEAQTGSAKRRLLAHLAGVKVAGARDWTREQLYD